tara:strand:+ start:871 stop:1149 length:279 start_codon:yes stop_codon:yes gene_type:complete
MENITIFGFPFIYLESLFGISTFLSLVPQIYTIITTEKVNDFSLIFIIGMLIVNILFFIVGFIDNLYGLMIGSFTFTLYNSLIVFYHYKNKK